MALTRDQILSSTDLPKQEVQTPEWGGSVWVRTMTAAERDAFEQESLNSRGPDNKANLVGVRARLAARTICDDKGERLFTDADVAALNSKSGLAMGRVFNAASRLNGLSKSDVEELAKN